MTFRCPQCAGEHFWTEQESDGTLIGRCKGSPVQMQSGWYVYQSCTFTWVRTPESDQAVGLDSSA